MHELFNRSNNILQNEVESTSQPQSEKNYNLMKMDLLQDCCVRLP